MRRKLTALALIAKVFFVLQGSSAYADTATGIISITIRDSVNARPIKNASVIATSRSGNEKRIQSGVQGKVSFTKMSAGLYRIEINHPNYLAANEPSIRVVDGKATPLKVNMLAKKNRVEETIVTGRAVAADPYASVSASYIDREALRSATGSGSDILRALDGLPGLFSSGDFASFSVRGNGPRDNLILVEGIPFDNVVHFDQSLGEQEDVEGGGRYSVFAPNLIGGAEFSPGGFGAAYGGRSGSLLKLDVADGNALTPSYTARVDLAGIEVGYDGPSKIHEDTSILFSARHLDFGQLFDIIDEKDIGEPVLTDIIFKSTTQLENDEFRFLVIYAPEEYERTIKHVLESPAFEDVSLINSEKDNTLITINWKRQFGNSGEMVHRLYYKDAEQTASEGEAFPDIVAPGTPGESIPKRERLLTVQQQDTEIGLRSDISVINDFGKFTFGTRINRIALDYSTTLRENWVRYVYNQNDFRPNPEQQFVLLTPESVNASSDIAEYSYAAYLDQVFEIDNWELRPSLRLERDGFSEETLVSPRFAANWQINPKTRLSTNAGVYYQSPRFIDRTNDLSNAGLENEKTTQISIGLRHYFSPDINLLVEPYYQQLDNLVVEADRVTRISSNSGEGHSYGIDTVLSKHFTDNWSANISYSYNNAEIDNKNGERKYDADFNRPHAFAIGGVWEINSRWKLSSRWKWASGKPKDDFIINENIFGRNDQGNNSLFRYSKEITATNASRNDSFHSLNFRADYRHNFGRYDLIAFIDVINVYGAANPDNAEFNERTGDNVEEEGDALPLLGFRFEW